MIWRVGRALAGGVGGWNSRWNSSRSDGRTASGTNGQNSSGKEKEASEVVDCIALKNCNVGEIEVRVRFGI